MEMPSTDEPKIVSEVGILRYEHEYTRWESRVNMSRQPPSRNSRLRGLYLGLAGDGTSRMTRRSV